jgi:hypothetical protein
MAALPDTGGSATELSATDAWRKAAVSGEPDMVVRQTNSESFAFLPGARARWHRCHDQKKAAIDLTS